MQMLHAGKVPAFTDDKRPSDLDNPLGYFEAEAVANLANDSSWLGSATGMAIKITSPLLPSLPARYDYKIIFVLRDVDEILRSQRRMLLNRGQPDPDNDDEMAQIFSEHLESSLQWLRRQPNVELLEILHRNCVFQPADTATTIGRFLGGKLDTARMAAVVKPELYRQRHQN
ncbi:hypothetical protein [Mesorhizobium caraganae]|uniref:hypothetical protein n=1 Tax=Mesorhizobium caraganae TaxID=483206 RepID=UPI003ECD72CE